MPCLCLIISNIISRFIKSWKRKRELILIISLTFLRSNTGLLLAFNVWNLTFRERSLWYKVLENTVYKFNLRVGGGIAGVIRTAIVAACHFQQEVSEYYFLNLKIKYSNIFNFWTIQDKKMIIPCLWRPRRCHKINIKRNKQLQSLFIRFCCFYFIFFFV